MAAPGTRGGAGPRPGQEPEHARQDLNHHGEGQAEEHSHCGGC